MRLEIEPNITSFPMVDGNLSREFEPESSWSFDSTLKKGIAAAQNGERDSARKLLSQASAIDPSNEDAWMWMASISEYPEELLAYLNRVLDINPQNARALQWRAATNAMLAKTFVDRAVAAVESDSHDLARQCLENALAFDQQCEAAWLWKARLAETDEEKLELLNQVLVLNPQNEDAQNGTAAIANRRSQAVFNRAKEAAAAGNRRKAGDILKEFVKDVPDSVEAWLLKSHLSAGLDEKLDALEHVLQIDPQNTAARSGVEYLKLTFGLDQTTADEAESETGPYATVEVTEEDETSEFGTQTSEPVAYDEATADESVATNEVGFDAGVEESNSPVESENVSPFADFAHGEPAAVRDDFESEAVNDDALVRFDSADVSESEEFSCDNQNPFAETAGNDVFEQQEPEAASPFADEPYQFAAEDVRFATFDDTDAAAFAEPAASYPGAACPFCNEANDPQAFDCASCRAALTLSDIESLLAAPNANQEVVRNAVTAMEAEWNLREFDERELTELGIGHLNLGNLDSGLKYLQEASRLNSNNVILAGQVNTIAIRRDEMRRQAENYDAMPKGKTILVVDDSATVRKLISGKLEKSGHNVVCAADGVEGLAMLDNGMPDLILLDITMPRMDGYEVCKQIRSNPAGQDVPIVMISGKDGFFDKVRGRMAGTTGYVTKPFGPETLMKALETYLLPESVEAN